MGQWRQWQKISDGPFQGTPQLASSGGLGSTEFGVTIRDRAGDVHWLSPMGDGSWSSENLGGGGLLAEMPHGGGMTGGTYATGRHGRLYSQAYDFDKGVSLGWQEVPDSPRFEGPVWSTTMVPEGSSVAFGAGADHQLHYLFQRSGPRAPLWYELGKPGRSGGKKGVNGPPSVAFGHEELSVFVRGRDNHLWRTSGAYGVEYGPQGPVPNGFQEWENLGGGLSQPPVGHHSHFGTEAYVVGEQAELWLAQQKKGEEGYSWHKLGGEIKGVPALASNRESRETFVFCRGSDDQLWYRRRVGEQWKRWQAVGKGLSGEPALWWEAGWGEQNPATITAVVLRNEGELWQRSYRLTGSG